MHGIYPNQPTKDYEQVLERAMVLARSGSPANFEDIDLVILLHAAFEKIVELETKVNSLMAGTGSIPHTQ